MSNPWWIATYSNESKVQQEFRYDNDQNLIMRQIKSGVNPLPIVPRDVQYGNNIRPSYLEAKLMVARVNQDFAALSADVRSKFDNDPVKFLDFLDNPSNYQRAVDLGILDSSVLESVQSSSKEELVAAPPVEQA